MVPLNSRLSVLLSLLATIVLSLTIFAQNALSPDWRALANRYPVLGDMFRFVEGDGYSFDAQSAESKTIAKLFLLTAIPVRPPSKLSSLDARLYYATPQPTAGLVTSVIDSELPDVVPTEAVIVYARFVSDTSMEFKGQFTDSRKQVVYGFFDPSDMSITMKQNDVLLGRATRQLQREEKCFEQLNKGETAKCSGPLPKRLGCAVAAWIYADDQCRRVAKGGPKR